MRSSVLLLLAVRIQTDLAALPVEAAPPGTGRMVGHSDAVLDHSALGFDADPVVNSGSNALLVAEVSLGRLN